jgi:hypothetical protein
VTVKSLIKSWTFMHLLLGTTEKQNWLKGGRRYNILIPINVFVLFWRRKNYRNFWKNFSLHLFVNAVKRQAVIINALINFIQKLSNILLSMLTIYVEDIIGGHYGGCRRKRYRLGILPTFRHCRRFVLLIFCSDDTSLCPAIQNNLTQGSCTELWTDGHRIEVFSSQ